MHEPFNRNGCLTLITNEKRIDKMFNGGQQQKKVLAELKELWKDSGGVLYYTFKSKV